MARGGKRSQDLQADVDWKPTQAVDNPILNSPYEEPSRYWDYVKSEGGVAVPEEKSGRRPAAYFFKTSARAQQLQNELFAGESELTEQLDNLEIPNRLREDVRRWRKAGYRGASPVTRELFRYWFDPERGRRLFFCQREAVETIVYLLELAIPNRLAATGWKNFQLDAALLGRLLRGERSELSGADDENPVRLIDIPADPSLLPLTRLGLRMATGSGKTLVMAMIITWAFCNRGVNPASVHFPNAVLVCAPNLTVKSRLQVLRPDHAQSYYRVFDLVPAKYAPFVQQGKVLVTNWHGLAPKSEHREGDKTYRVVEKGEETNDAFARDRLGELVHRLPILVLNDEGHHCWRPKTKDVKIEGETAEEKKALEDEVEEARVWLAGLDRINNAGLLKGADGKPERCILAAIDLSATPFYLAASGYPEGSPFPWLVTSFGLMDAIESGIVKIPRLPVLDDKNKKDELGRPDPKYFRLWKHITESLGANDKVAKRPKPEALYERSDDALKTLASQWKLKFDQHMCGVIGGSAVPPVMIIVCDNTDLADLVFQKVSGERVREVVDDKGKVKKITVYEGSAILAELSNDENVRRTVRIDSRLLDKLERSEGESKDEAALALRTLIDTVGKPGQPGEHVRCVVSVSMLTEGWDANNVTHILGIRAFGSQLLCEQVVGRGLRRMSYDVGPDGRLAPEYVDVYGIPFSLIPFKGKGKTEKTTEGPKHRVFAVPERAHLEIRMPVVEGYTYDIRDSGIHCNVDALEALVVNEEPTTVWLRVPRDVEDEGFDLSREAFVRQTREEYYKSTRLQQIVFRVAQQIVDDLIQGGTGKNRVHARRPPS